MIKITPVPQISHLKAGIFAEGYDHILSFRRQMYIKYEDIPKLPNSLLISANDSQFRIFFSDDKITCFICKSAGHTSLTCKKSILNNMEISSSPHQTIVSEHNSKPENQKSNKSTSPNHLSVLQCSSPQTKRIQPGTSPPNPQLTNDRPLLQQPHQPLPAHYIQLHKCQPS
ncbi:hypothetical protein O181_100524 [Austropuccinia psidii MF-1]|uniref:CCHC-type domain-containing protein n=1 Tax=Austropuccinia psidii MF-1 TaxID=1389203 RepID=A0A9Q3PGH3_9BASI|nr:hypothetical protein [Austropuccinia psidii MF-1]